MRVNILGEGVNIKGQGVNTAFMSMFAALEKTDVQVELNGERDADIIHVHTVGLKNLRRMRQEKRKGKKIIINAHLVMESMLGSLFLSYVWGPAFKRYLTWFYNHADLVLAVSPYVKQLLQKAGVTVPIAIMPNTVDRKQIKKQEINRETLGYHHDDFIMIGIGQLQPRKGLQMFTDVARALPESQFIWLGHRPFSLLTAGYFSSEQIIKHAPKNVKFIGYIPREKVNAYINAADVFFFPSLQETFGIVVLEAASCNLPLLLNDLPTYPEIFGDHYLRARSKQEYIDLIQQLHQNKKLYATYQQHAEKIAQQYDERKVTKQLIQLYRDVMNGQQQNVNPSAKTV